MSFLTGKGLLLLGLIIVLLVAIPITIFVVQRQQQTQSGATPSTTLGFSPPSTESAPLQKNVGDTFSFDILMNPGQNQVSRVQLFINYDATKIMTATDSAAGCGSSLCPNTAVFPATIEGPTYKDGQAYIYLSIGTDITKALQQPDTKIATILLKAIAASDIPTKITFDTQTQAGSILCDQITGNCPDPLGENVIVQAGLQSAFVKIGAAAVTTPTITAGPTVAVAPTVIPVQAPTCASLVADRTTAAAGSPVTFTVVGTDTKPLSKITFDYGDNSQQDISQGNGIGTTNVTAQIQHTYATAGTYNATAVLTNNANAVSNPATCSQTITVSAAVVAVPATPIPFQPQQQTLAPTGPENSLMLGVGGIGALLIVAGSVLFFIL